MSISGTEVFPTGGNSLGTFVQRTRRAAGSFLGGLGAKCFPVGRCGAVASFAVQAALYRIGKGAVHRRNGAGLTPIIDETIKSVGGTRHKVNSAWGAKTGTTT